MIMAATSIVSPVCPAGSLVSGTQGLVVPAPLRGRWCYHPCFIREESGEAGDAFTGSQAISWKRGFEPQRTGPKAHSRSTAALCLPAPGTEEAKVTPPGGPWGSQRVWAGPELLSEEEGACPPADMGGSDSDRLTEASLEPRKTFPPAVPPMWELELFCFSK